MNIRLARKEDSDSLEDLTVTVGGEEWRKLAHDYIQCMLSQDFRRPAFLVAMEGNKLVGCAAISEELFTVDVWGISWVNVHPDHERRGIGQKLVEACLDEISRRAGKRVTVILNTYPGKTGLYDKTGFHMAGHDHDGGCLMINYVGGKDE